MYSFVKDEPIKISDIKKKLKDVTSFGTDIDDILGEDSDFDFGRKLAAEFIDRVGTQDLPQV